MMDVMPQIGRPRPHFVSRCWPNGLEPVFSPDGVPLCADSALDPLEGIKVRSRWQLAEA